MNPLKWLKQCLLLLIIQNLVKQDYSTCQNMRGLADKNYCSFHDDRKVNLNQLLSFEVR